MILVIARSEATKQSSFLCCGDMDCFAEPVIGRRSTPTRWLAMTKDSSFLLPRETAEARQGWLAAQSRKPRQVRQALAQARGEILRQRWHPAWPCTARHLFGERLHLLGRGHAAAKTHRLCDAGHRTAFSRAHGLHHVGHVPVHLEQLVDVLDLDAGAGGDPLLAAG